MLMLTGCVTQPSRLGEYRLADINHWTAKGKLGLRTSDNRRSANFAWQNRNSHFDIRLSGPFGQGAVSLARDSELVVLKTSKQTLRAQSPEELLYEATGWTLPISELAWWIKGLASPSAVSPQSKEVNNQGDLIKLRQQGWEIDYKDYRDIASHRLPHKLIARRNGIRLTLAIKSWSLKPPASQPR